MSALGRYIDPQAIAQVAQLALNPRSLVAGSQAGAHKSPFHGFSVEFAGHREYMPGDDTKHIDWVVYYKRDRYMIKQYEAETNLVCQVLLDGSESMRFGSPLAHGVRKLDFAAMLATSLAYLVTRVRDRIGLGLFADEVIEYLPPSGSMAAVYKLDAALQALAARGGTKLSEPILDLANRMGRRQVVVLISDFLCDPEELIQAIGRLRFDRHEVVLMQVLDPWETDFPLDGRVRFVGLEGLGELRLSPRQLRNAYLERLEAHNHRLLEICETNGAEYVRLDSSRPVGEALFAYLTSRLTHVAR